MMKYDKWPEWKKEILRGNYSPKMRTEGKIMENKNKMKEVAALLGLELDEEFNVKFAVYNPHRITESGLQFYFCSAIGIGAHWQSGVVEKLLINSELIEKLPWKPKLGEHYYRPSIAVKRVAYMTWLSNDVDNNLFDLGLVCKTKEQAEEKLKEVIKKLKECESK